MFISSEDITKSVTLRCISNKALSFLGDILKYPFTSEITIRRHLTQFLPEFLDLIFTLLDACVNVFTDFDKDVTFCFDANQISATTELDIPRWPYTSVSRPAETTLPTKRLRFQQSTGQKRCSFLKMDRHIPKGLSELSVTQDITIVKSPFTGGCQI